MYDDDEKIPDTFIKYASTIIDTGISVTEIIKLSVKYAVDSNVNIPYNSQPEIPSKKIALFENLKALNGQQQYEMIKEICERSPCHSKVKNKLISNYSHLSSKNDPSEVNEILIEETKHWLENYPEALSLYSDALTKYEHDTFNRNLLDDLRLSLESLLKEIFQNNKTLENQIPSIGTFIKGNSGSKELSNMFGRLLNYYASYQNSYVKHNDAVIEEEIEFIMEITSSFMKHLIRLNQKG